MKKMNKTFIPKQIISGLLAACVLISAVGGTTAFAQESTFSQVIRYVDCTHVSLENGAQPNDPDCSLFSPQFIASGVSADGYLTLRGIYDAIHTVQNTATGAPDLTVTINGRAFVLGRDPELTVQGNIWTLNLSAWQTNHPGDDFMPVKRGAVYNGTVIAKMQQNATAPVLEQSGFFSITIPTVVKEIVENIKKTLANTGGNVWLIIASGVPLIVIAAILLFLCSKRRGLDGR